MSEQYEHVCISPDCTKKYSDTDVDAYYCPECVKLNKARYAEIEQRVQARRKSKPKPQSFDERMSNYHSMKGITFINLPKNGNS